MLSKLISLKNHHGFMKYFRNTSWLFAEKILRMAVGLFVGIWVARYLGPEQFGLFSYAISFVGLFLVFSTLGLDSIVVRELVKDEEKREKLLGTAFYLKLMGSFLVLAFLAIVISFTPNDKETNTLIFIIASATIFQSFNVVDMYFQSKVMSKYVVYANVLSLFLGSLLKIALIISGATLVAFAWVILFENIVLAMGYLYFFIKSVNRFSKYLIFSKTTARYLLKNSWPLILSGLVISIYMKIDQIMIKEMLGSASVGQYAAAVRLSEAWYFIPLIISSSLFPAIINAKKVSGKGYYDRLQKLYNLMVWMAISIALPMTFLSSWIISLLYGDQYNEAGSVLMIHIWAGVFVFLGVASGKWLIAENLQILSFWRTFLGVVVNVIFNVLLIPKYGIQGAAVATLLGQVSAAYAFDLFHVKTREMFYMKTKSLLFMGGIKLSVR